MIKIQVGDMVEYAPYKVQEVLSHKVLKFQEIMYCILGHFVPLHHFFDFPNMIESALERS